MTQVLTPNGWRPAGIAKRPWQWVNPETGAVYTPVRFL